MAAEYKQYDEYYEEQIRLLKQDIEKREHDIEDYKKLVSKHKSREFTRMWGVVFFFFIFGLIHTFIFKTWVGYPILSIAFVVLVFHDKLFAL